MQAIKLNKRFDGHIYFVLEDFPQDPTGVVKQISCVDSQNLIHKDYAFSVINVDDEVNQLNGGDDYVDIKNIASLFGGTSVDVICVDNKAVSLNICASDGIMSFPYSNDNITSKITVSCEKGDKDTDLADLSFIKSKIAL